MYRLFLWAKKSRLDSYQTQITDRFVKDITPIFDKKTIWCHAVSLGELNTAYPLLRLLLDDGYNLYITSTTQTGYNRAKTLFADDIYQNRVANGFVPVDDKAVIERFIDKINPCLVLFVETELWANTLFVLAQRGIASVMINARLTKKSFDSYNKFKQLSQSMMTNLSFVVAQDALSVKHFMALGLSPQKIAEADSLKWASVPKLDDSLLAKLQDLPKDRFVWTAGSTHQTEETICLNTHKNLCEKYADKHPLLIIVPRHPQRFDEVYRLCLSSGLGVARESLGQGIDRTTQVFLADSMGRLMLYYKACEVAFVGGSLIDKGGHTPIEPLSQAKPVIMGQYTKNASVLIEALSDSVQIVSGQTALFEVLSDFINNPKKIKALGQFGKNVIDDKQFAHKQQKQYLEQFLDK